MQPDVLPDPGDLWWSWVALAALSRASGDDSCRFDAGQRMLHLDLPDGSWLRMQRVLGSRTTLWGRSLRAPRVMRDPRELAPDWAVTEAALGREPSFVAWHAHGEWDTSSPGTDEGAAHLLRPLLTVDPRAIEAVRGGRVDPEALSAWTDGGDVRSAVEVVLQAAATAATASYGAVRTRLRNQIHEQMRDAAETDRVLMQRPPALVRWSRVNGPGHAFEHAVLATPRGLVPSPMNTPLAEPAARTLANVLATLHREEADEESGAWLFARATSDGVGVRFTRAFDSWPQWFRVQDSDQGPSMDDLAWEMDQRAPRWRPAWASLLPLSTGS